MAVTCRNCKKRFVNHINYCTQCGTAIKRGVSHERSRSLNLIITFYVVFLLFAFIAYLVYDHYEFSLGLELAVEAGFACLVLLFSAFDYQDVLRLYKIPAMNWKPWLFSFVFPVLSAFLVYYAIEELNVLLFEEYYDNSLADYMTLSQPLAWAIFFIAILPPIFEELAFRGFLFNQVQKVASNKVTIIATAFIFALVHFSFISLLWIFPFGLVLGYLRSKYQTLWLGMVVHFIHNLIVVLLDYGAYFQNISLD